MNTRVTDASRSMRKAPRQRRSQVMVDVILQAAARVLAKSGWAKFNTNEVARIAGVSIGSLYQYFPNKLALAEAIRQQHLAAILQVLAGAATEEKFTRDTG
jgi:AcrR family transcriptional regulator